MKEFHELCNEMCFKAGNFRNMFNYYSVDCQSVFVRAFNPIEYEKAKNKVYARLQRQFAKKSAELGPDSLKNLPRNFANNST